MYLIVIQSRNGSSRLPNKSLLSLNGNTVLLHVLNRIKKTKLKRYKLIVATSTNIEDDPIFNLCKNENIYCLRGDPLDVLSRFRESIKKFCPDYVIRITGDCPLIYTPLIDEITQIIERKKEIDYASNTLKRTFPHGMDVEVFKADILFSKNEPSDYDKEHVTPFLYSSNNFNLYSYENLENASNYRITLDTYSDYIFLENLLLKSKSFFRNKNNFDLLSPQEIIKIINEDKKLQILHEKAKSSSGFNYD